MIRRAKPNDAVAIAALMLQLGYEVPAADVAGRLQRLDERREVFVAARGDRVTGWIAVCADEPFVDGFSAQIEGLVVDETTRSAGIGAELLAAAEAWSRERGCRFVRVQSNVLRERAHGFYRRLGYEAVKKQFHLRKPL
ncbi:MAG TPA: GNAT family N-acetyltransferase [Candidatus Nitrosotalea sp.]|nr:GNAT family N-acetyltransferase [Candidatus Nitrosotalea sp.]